jgi:hypothetical protein
MSGANREQRAGDASAPPEWETDQEITAPHSVLVTVRELDDARTLIEYLEQSGVPSTAISLIEPAAVHPIDGGEGEVYGEVARSVLMGAVAGALVGALLGYLASLATGLPPLMAMALGALFGAGVGGAAGGMSVVKYSSPAWRQTHEAAPSNRFKVGVQHSDAEVVETAEELMTRHGFTEVARVDS